MTDAPFALPLRFAPDEVYGPEYGWIVDANEYCPWGDMNDKTTADFLIRAVNSYNKMRETLVVFQPPDVFNTAYSDDHLVYVRLGDLRRVRAILKEIDNGR